MVRTAMTEMTAWAFIHVLITNMFALDYEVRYSKRNLSNLHNENAAKGQVNIKILIALAFCYSFHGQGGKGTEIE